MSSRPGPWLLALALGVAVVFALLTGPSTAPPLGRGSNAPDFALESLDGERIALADLRGRVVLVNFWATWCKPCEDEMPAMERLYQELAGDGFELLAVSVDENVEPVAEFQQRLALSFPILLDADKDVSREYQTFRFPETFLVGPDGVVIERYIGPKDWDAKAYADRIRRLLAPS